MGMTLVQGATVEDLAAVGLRATGVLSSAEQASVSPDPQMVVARQIDGWLVLVEPGTLVAAEDETLSSALHRRVVAALFGSTSDTYSFAVCEVDRTRRHLVDSMGERVVDEGASLPQENRVETLAEDTMIDLLGEVAGVNVWPAFAAPDWEVLAGGGPTTAM
ncbi:hypothetical protein GCM10022199_14920 [Marihabitans asiaticum]|uniref:Uncharacterized protein n=2 Tax=Marihabitans asiaticum TaxID=415218 RepID=A0A560W8G6_9MICO|nr:hypothetical protein FB557_2455 [Marihabitans asiaticum]